MIITLRATLISLALINLTIAQELYNFTSHTFTNAGATGKFGPNLTQIKTAYASKYWAQDTVFLNMSTQGIQRWTVPKSGWYKITASGAAGGGGGGMEINQMKCFKTKMTKNQNVLFLTNRSGFRW